MAHTDLILVASTFCWGSFCWLFIMHLGSVWAMSNCRREVFARHLILELYARSITDRIFRVSSFFVTMGMLQNYMPKLGNFSDNIYLFVSGLPLLKNY